MANFGWRYRQEAGEWDGTIDGSMSGSSTLEVVGATTLGNSLTVSGTFSGSGFVAAAGFANAKTIDATTTIPANYNSILYGPITIANGTALTVGAGSNLEIKDFSENSEWDGTTTSTISGSSTLEIVGATTLGNTLSVSGTITAASHILPSADNSVNLGSASKRWANLYTGDLHLKNERGDWTIVEEEDYLSVINNKTGKKYKMVLEEIE
tara:strand:+ start:105 stop:734 length:630 start_codon:yes stop_codon:yes gene_type:complete